jgi:hypothetical protein
MAKATDERCEVCGQQPATSGGWWCEPGVVSQCEDCMVTALTYTYLIDSLEKRQCLPGEVIQQATALLKDMRERMGLSTELAQQTLAALGVKLVDTTSGEE